MLDLGLRVGSARVVASSAVPALDFPVEVECSRPLRSLAVQARIYLEPASRPAKDLSAREREWLRPLFGEPEQWSRSVTSLYWTQVPLSGAGDLRVACSFDMQLAATRYLYALEGGEAELRWSFAGTAFWEGPAGLQVSPVRSGLEVRSRLSVALWHDLMARHYGQQVCVPISAEAFARLERYRNQHNLLDWDALCDRLVGP